jgi:cbb3-type cytochrome oxidase subunit 3
LEFCNRLLLEDAYPEELARTYRSHVRVIQTLGVFALTYFLVCLFFSLRKGPPHSAARPAEELPLGTAG